MSAWALDSGSRQVACPDVRIGKVDSGFREALYGPENGGIGSERTHRAERTPKFRDVATSHSSPALGGAAARPSSASRLKRNDVDSASEIPTLLERSVARRSHPRQGRTSDRPLIGEPDCILRQSAIGGSAPARSRPQSPQHPPHACGQAGSKNGDGRS